MKKLLSILAALSILISMCACDFSSGNPGSSDGYPYNAIAGEIVPDKGDGGALSIESDKVLSVLQNIGRPDTYIWKADVTYYAGDTSVTYSIVKYVSNNMERWEKYDAFGRLLMYSIYRNNTLYVIDNQSRGYYVKKDFDKELLDSTASLADPILALEMGEADSISNICFDYVDEKSVLSFDYKDDGLSFLETYQVSMSDGIPMRVVSMFDSKTSYTLITTEVTYEKADDDMFLAPSYVR